MSRLAVVNQYRDQSVAQVKSRALLDPTNESKLQIFESRISINWFALLSVSVILISFGFFLGQKISPKIDDVGLQKQQQKIIQLLSQQLEQQKGERYRESDSRALINMAKAEFQKAMASKAVEPERIIREQREYIEDLKKQLAETASLRIRNTSRSVASTNNGYGAETIPFSRTNESVLYYEHKLEREDLNKKLEREQKVFFEAYDMSKEENQEKFEELKKKHKVALYELEQEQYQARSDFKKNQYRLKK